MQLRFLNNHKELLTEWSCDCWWVLSKS